MIVRMKSCQKNVLFFLFIMALISSNAWANEIDDCLNLSTMNHHKQAFPICLQLAEKGNAEAQDKVGKMYEYGWGVKKDHTLAERWLRKSAMQGLASAQTHLGNFYARRSDMKIKVDMNKALKWYRKAAKQDNSEAIFSLGLMYEMGYGVKKDSNRAGKLLYQAGLISLQNGDTTGANMILMFIKSPPDLPPSYATKLEEKINESLKRKQ